MDYILSKINEDLEVAKSNSFDECTLLKERVEYSIIMAMGYLYHKNIEKVGVDSIKKINDNLRSMTFGKTIENIRLLDLEKEMGSGKKNRYEVLNGYTNIRNKYIGHGYIHEDALKELHDEYEKYYMNLEEIEWFKIKKQYILITGKNDNNYEGIRFDYHTKNRWECKRNLLESKFKIKINDVFLFINGKYFKISPFIIVENKGNKFYVFSSLEEKRIGQIKMCRLIDTENDKKIIDPDFICDQIENEQYKMSSNGVIMNKFELNYKTYMETPVEKDIFEYLKCNTSNVQATLWGHGGVGKTAAVQYVCESIFRGECDESCTFKYIVFVTAKDRKFDPQSGDIVKVDNLKTYNDIIRQIIKIVFNENIIDDEPKTIIENEERIANFRDKILLVIDDYETFIDADKQSIQEFINTLNINYHRVIITTRNKKLANGIPIQTSEFDENQTVSFVRTIIEYEYPNFKDKVDEILASKENIIDIYKATEGRAISIHHFVNLLVQRGFSNELLKELHDSINMSKFLYDKIYSLLSKDAQVIFCCISLLANEENLVFSLKTLEFVSDEISFENSLDDSIEELILQKVIEKSNTELLYRVYADNILNEMRVRYTQLNDKVKKLIEKKKKQLGGSFEIRSIDDALLKEARKTGISGTYEETKESYLRLIRNKKIGEDTRKTAICEFLEIVMINVKSSKDIIENKNFLYNPKDKNCEKKYIIALWNTDKNGKTLAIQLLMKKEVDLDKEQNYDIASLKIWYCISYYVEKYNDTKDQSYLIKIKELLKNTNKLFDLRNKRIDKLKIENWKEALLTTMEAICIVYCNEETQLKKLKFYLEFCKKNFKGSDFRRTMEIEKKVITLLKNMVPAILRKYNEEEILEATVMKINKNAVKCKIDPNFNVFLFDKDNADMLKRGDRIFVKIKNITRYHEVEVSYKGYKEIE